MLVEFLLFNLFATVGVLFTLPLGLSSLYEGKVILGAWWQI